MDTKTETDLTALPRELQETARSLERPGRWEVALWISLGVALVSMLLTVAFHWAPLRLDVSVHGAIVFGAVALVVLLALFAAERARRGSVSRFHAIAELMHRHMRSEQALRDPLTGAYNRAALQELAANHIRRAERASEPLTLLVCDLDKFHDLNSIHGHIAGDLALVEFARVLFSSTRGADLVARYGGDEFVVLLSETPREGAETVVSRITDRVGKRNGQLDTGQIPLEFTVGLATFRKGLDFTELFQLADVELLRRKAARGQTSRH